MPWNRAGDSAESSCWGLRLGETQKSVPESREQADFDRKFALTELYYANICSILGVSSDPGREVDQQACSNCPEITPAPQAPKRTRSRIAFKHPNVLTPYPGLLEEVQPLKSPSPVKALTKPGDRKTSGQSNSVIWDGNPLSKPNQVTGRSRK